MSGLKIKMRNALQNFFDSYGVRGTRWQYVPGSFRIIPRWFDEVRHDPYYKVFGLRVAEEHRHLTNRMINGTPGTRCARLLRGFWRFFWVFLSGRL